MKYFPQYQSFQCQDQLLVAPCKKKRSKLYEHYTDYPCSNCLERFKHHTQLARHKQQAHAEPNLINTPPSPPPDNHTQEPAQLGTFIRDLCLIDRHIYKPLLEVAKSILTLLDRLHTYRVEEWYYWPSDGIFVTEGKFMGTGTNIIRVAQIPSLSHYVLLDTRIHPNCQWSTLQDRKENQLFLQGNVKLKFPNGDVSYASIIDKGMYPWGDGQANSQPLKTITDVLDINSYSGTANACTYTHIMFGLFDHHPRP